ncbi:hypothetical protein [Pseudonocardia alni]|uniref:hypothetical protein n=1 Tax=Pseudonocardia alni TaxID=33907 RepID=UPI00279DE716|nr:hypothetical protein PaSha_12780 [Pseudonocardia alni]
MWIDSRTNRVPAVDPLFDGKASTRQVIAEQETARFARITALPLWAVVAMIAGAYGLLLLIGLGEYAPVRAAVGTVLPELSAPIQVLLAVAFCLAYSVAFHTVGSRIAAARATVLPSLGDGGRPGLRAFGVLGAVALGFGVASMLVVAFSRAEVLAAEAGEAAARRVSDASLDGAVDPAAVEAARRAAHDEVFGPDLRWTLVVLLLMALATVVVAAGTAPWKKALQIGLRHRSLDRLRSRVDAARVRESRAQLEMVSRIEARERRQLLAEQHERELPMRFAAAKERFRVTLAERLGDPEATSELLRRRP